MTRSRRVMAGPAVVGVLAGWRYGPSAAALARAGPDALELPRTRLFAPCRSERGIRSKGFHLLSMSRVAPCAPAAWHTLAGTCKGKRG